MCVRVRWQSINLCVSDVACVSVAGVERGAHHRRRRHAEAVPGARPALGARRQAQQDLYHAGPRPTVRLVVSRRNHSTRAVDDGRRRRRRVVELWQQRALGAVAAVRLLLRQQCP
eukprot:278018-Rhodomonas_salina.1